MWIGCRWAGTSPPNRRGRVLKRRPGMILVAVLLTVTVLLSAATGLAWFSRNQIRRVDGERRSLQGRSAAFLAIQQVMRGLVLDTNEYDSFLEDWFGSHIVPLQDMGVAFVDLKPLDDRLPLRALFLPDGQTLRKEMESPWERLWDRFGRADLEQALLDYMDKDGTPRLGGMEHEDFPNRPAEDLTVLLGCPGFDAVILYGDVDDPEVPRLRDYLSPWVKDKINVNVATAQTLLILDADLDEGVVESILERQAASPLKSMDDLGSVPGFPESAVPRLSGLLGFKSTYFAVDIQVQLLSGRPLVYSAILKKEGSRVSVESWKEF